MTDQTTTDAAGRDLEALAARRTELRDAHLRPAGERPESTARGLHHTALVSSDVETTIRFYQDVLGFPLTELIENRDYPGSSHFFFDIGNSNLLAFFDFPGLDVGPYQEVLGGCTTAPSPSSRRAGRPSSSVSPPRASSTRSTRASRSTSATPTAPASSSSPTLGEMYGEHVL